MTLADARKTHSWGEALALAPHLVTLSEALPSQEQNGLVPLLMRLMVELPAAVAQDLVRGTEERYSAAMSLVAAIEVVERVYPALDAAAARAALDALIERLGGDGFSEIVAVPEPAAPEPETEPAAPEVTIAPPEVAEALAAAASVVVTPAVSPESETVHVQPSSLQ